MLGSKVNPHHDQPGPLRSASYWTLRWVWGGGARSEQEATPRRRRRRSGGRTQGSAVLDGATILRGLRRCGSLPQFALGRGMESKREQALQHIADQLAVLAKFARDHDLDRLTYLLDSVRREARRLLANEPERPA